MAEQKDTGQSPEEQEAKQDQGKVQDVKREQSPQAPPANPHQDLAAAAAERLRRIGGRRIGPSIPTRPGGPAPRTVRDVELEHGLMSSGTGTGTLGEATNNYLEDGFRMTITMTGDTGNDLFPIVLGEITVKPVGYDGGEKIDTTTQRNVSIRTYSPRQLLGTNDGEFQVAYDISKLASIQGVINKKQECYFTFPDGTEEYVWGHLRSFEPDALEEGKRPTARMVFCPDNRTSTGFEFVPGQT